MFQVSSQVEEEVWGPLSLRLTFIYFCFSGETEKHRKDGQAEEEGKRERERFWVTVRGR